MFRLIAVLFVSAFELFLLYRTMLSYELSQKLAGLDDPRVLLTRRERRQLARSAVMQQEIDKLSGGTL
jgi:hypothetical protein